MSIRFDNRVAIVTGAGRGLGRAHALGLAARGAKVIVNDFGGDGAPTAAALGVAEEIKAAGGVAIADGADVSNAAQVSAMVHGAELTLGPVDILVNNAGILRDKSFGKMEVADFEKIIAVHLMGAVHCAKAVWESMRARKYGRIAFTTSTTGLYGNFGQTNYGAAKMALVGLMNSLHLEGVKYNIRVNCLAPTAATAMTEGLLPPDAMAKIKPELVTPALLYLVSEDAPSKVIIGAGGGFFAASHVVESAGVRLAEGECTPEGVAAHFADMSDMRDAKPLESAFAQTFKYLGM